MAKSATLAIRIVSDASKASAGFDTAESRVGKFQKGLDKASIAAGGVLAAVGGLAKGAFDAASNLQQSTGAIDSVFGDWALDIEQAAQSGAQSVGLATSAYENSAALIGAQLKSMGFTTADNVAKTQELIGTGADLAATFGGSTEDAVAALSSALKGERDPIERYGISLSQAAVDAKVAAMGLDTSNDAAKRLAQSQATMALITDQAGGSLGAFAREGDTAAGAQQRASAEFENAQAALGEVLLPIVAQASTKFAELTRKLVANKDIVIPLAAVVAGLAASVIIANAAVRTFQTMAKIATAAQWLWNAAMSANPIVLIVIAIAAVAAGVYLAYQKFSGFRSIVDSVGNALSWAFDRAKSAISWVVNKLSWVKSSAGFIGGLFSAPTAGLSPVAVPGGAGVYGAAAGSGVFGAAVSSSAGGGSAAGRGPTLKGGNTYNITVTGALDPQAVARQLRTMLRDLDRSAGRTAAVAR